MDDQKWRCIFCYFGYRTAVIRLFPVSLGIKAQKKRLCGRSTLFCGFTRKCRKIRRRIPGAGRLYFAGFFQIFSYIQRRIIVQCSHTGKISSGRFSHNSHFFFIDTEPVRVRFQIADCCFYILQRHWIRPLIRSTVLHTCYYKTAASQSAQIKIMG